MNKSNFKRKWYVWLLSYININYSLSWMQSKICQLFKNFHFKFLLIRSNKLKGFTTLKYTNSCWQPSFHSYCFSNNIIRFWLSPQSISPMRCCVIVVLSHFILQYIFFNSQSNIMSPFLFCIFVIPLHFITSPTCFTPLVFPSICGIFSVFNTFSTPFLDWRIFLVCCHIAIKTKNCFFFRISYQCPSAIQNTKIFQLFIFW